MNYAQIIGLYAAVIPVDFNLFFINPTGAVRKGQPLLNYNESG
jgi:hypothetical protein